MASKLLRRRIRTLLLLLLLLLIFARELRDRRDRVTRELSVDFSSLVTDEGAAAWQPEQPFRWFNGSHFGGRYKILQHLKDGGQGSVYLVDDMIKPTRERRVVKTISAMSRNALPAGLLPLFQNTTTAWPSEIGASLSIGKNTIGDTTVDERSAFVPVYDFFLTQNIDGSPDSWVWTMVTPYISGGTLVDLAKKLHDASQSSIEQLDQIYRPALVHLLTELRSLHQHGYCHDDIKPANIFIRHPTQWLLGDLGNTRNRQHGWHDTQLWRRRNQWSSCHLNDVRRALKSYMTFLRDASGDPQSFDIGFTHPEEDWAKMYWDFTANPKVWYDAVEPALKAGVETPGGIVEPVHSTFVGGLARKLYVDRELMCTALWYKLWFTF